jgi:hypothetical protein
MKLMLALGLSLAVLSPAAVARDPEPSALIQEYKAGEAVTLAPDTAYILVRAIRLEGFRFVRIEDREHFPPAVDRANFADLAGYIAFAKAQPYSVHLLAVKPGTYWLYGEKTRHYLEGPFLNCLCMGTVKFEARPGIITDLGLIRNLERETAHGKHPDAAGRTRELRGSRDVRAILVLPPVPDDLVPSALAALPRVPAEYRAAGTLPNIDGTMIDRISAMPGVIAYDRDRIIDVRTGNTLR